MTKQEKETIMSARLDVPIGGVNGWGDAGSSDHGNGAMSPPEPLTPDAEVLARLRVILGCRPSDTVEGRARDVMGEHSERNDTIGELRGHIAGLVGRAVERGCKIFALNEEIDTLKAEVSRDSTNATVETLRMKAAEDKARIALLVADCNASDDELLGVRAQLQWEQTSKAERQDRIDQLTANLESMAAHVDSLRSDDATAIRADLERVTKERDYITASFVGYREGVADALKARG